MKKKAKPKKLDRSKQAIVYLSIEDFFEKIGEELEKVKLSKKKKP